MSTGKHGGIDWEALRYFLCAARAKSLSGAARSLGVEHTTVGRRIAGLERRLGAALVDRGPSGLELTRLGQRVLRRALEMERLARAIGELGSSHRTQVRLVVPTGFTALLTAQLETLRHQHPTLSLDIVSSARRTDLRKHAAALAIRVGPIDDELLVARKLGEVGSALYASRSYLSRNKAPMDLGDLRGHAVIGFHKSLSQMPAAEWLAARTAHASVVMHCREAVDMLTAALNGAGVAVLPCFLADAEASLVRLTPEPIATRRVSLVYRREANLSPELRSVIAFIVEVTRKHAAELRGRR